MGHFGKRPIRIVWYVLVLPALLLNYLGQGALLIGNPSAAENLFYRPAPEWALYPLIVLATSAAIIASQALISKYSPPGTGILVAAARAEGGMISIAVEDDGQGIPADLRERVFDKFFRATRDGDSGGTSRPAVTGMVLAIARGIVEAHGGRIRIEGRAAGTGSRVVFTLPISDEGAAADVRYEAAPGRAAGESPVTAANLNGGGVS